MQYVRFLYSESELWLWVDSLCLGAWPIDILLPNFS